MEISKTDAGTIVRYLTDAMKLYESLGATGMQKCVCRAEMIRQMIEKLNRKKNDNK